MHESGFASPLSDEVLAELSRRALLSRGHVLTATTLAASGHPGGSFSSMEIYTLLYSLARLRPADPSWADRDCIVVSHGHTSPGVYSALAAAGFFPAEEFTAHFRQAGSIFEGHVERSVPGVEWSSGNLGQGLSAGVGFALGARLKGADWHTFVLMSDAEQHKGQVAEARRLAVKERLGALTVVVDWNRVQISGHTDTVMPVPIVADWEADGWRVIQCDGHDLSALHAAIADGIDDGVPTAVFARTLIGKGVSFMEDDPEYHGRGLTPEEYGRAMAELGLDTGELETARERRAKPCSVAASPHAPQTVAVDPGTPRTYGPAVSTDNRSAWGAALTDLASANPDLPIAVLDCDLAGSVKTDGFAKIRPTGFIECGVGEHNAATVAGALSIVPGVLALWSDFGVFGIDEVYNQQRLNDINATGLKLVVTHCGLDVGEDGRTHQCLDYVGAFRTMFGWTVIVPADPNQTDRAVRAAVGLPGNVVVAMGRSKLPTVLAESGLPLFGEGYEFALGEIVWAREGNDAVVLAMGTLAGAAVAAADFLREEGIEVEVGIVACPLDLDDPALDYAAAAPLLFTVEDHSIHSGLGASVAEWLAAHGSPTRLVKLGVDGYQSSGTAKDLFARVGLDASGIATTIRKEIEKG
ncbi:MAG: transketolase [Coriobacteriia bacterium]|nr:transketolase [Coriobacteriia bacterium]